MDIKEYEYAHKLDPLLASQNSLKRNVSIMR